MSREKMRGVMEDKYYFFTFFVPRLFCRSDVLLSAQEEKEEPSKHRNKSEYYRILALYCLDVILGFCWFALTSIYFHPEANSERADILWSSTMPFASLSHTARSYECKSLCSSYIASCMFDWLFSVCTMASVLRDDRPCHHHFLHPPVNSWGNWRVWTKKWKKLKTPLAKRILVFSVFCFTHQSDILKIR